MSSEERGEQRSYFFAQLYTLACRKVETMGARVLIEIIQAWEREQLTTEQAIGQILLLLQELEERLRIVENRLGRRVEQ